MIRTVSLLPAAAEIVGALGLMDQLLVVSHECDYPDEASRRPRGLSGSRHRSGFLAPERRGGVTSAAGQPIPNGFVYVPGLRASFSPVAHRTDAACECRSASAGVIVLCACQVPEDSGTRRQREGTAQASAWTNRYI
jgi:hypothetical protein